MDGDDTRFRDNGVDCALFVLLLSVWVFENGVIWVLENE